MPHKNTRDFIRRTFLFCVLVIVLFSTSFFFSARNGSAAEGSVPVADVVESVAKEERLYKKNRPNLQICYQEERLLLYVPDGKKTVTESQTAALQIGSSGMIPAELMERSEIPEAGVHTTLLFDNSFSILEENRERMKWIARDLVEHHAEGEQFTLCVYDREVHVLAENSMEYDTILRMIEEIEFQNQDSCLKDALFDVCGRVRSSELLYHRFLIFSDGSDDNQAGYTEEEIQSLFREAGYPVYVVGSRFEQDIPALGRLCAIARSSGGRSFLLNWPEEEPLTGAEVLGDDLHVVAAGMEEETPALLAAGTIPRNLQDGSLRNIRLIIDSGDEQTEYTGQIQMPFAPPADGEAEDDEKADGEDWKEGEEAGKVWQEEEEREAAQIWQEGEEGKAWKEGAYDTETNDPSEQEWDVMEESKVETNDVVDSSENLSGSPQKLIVICILIAAAAVGMTAALRDRKKEHPSIPRPDHIQEGEATVLLQGSGQETAFLRDPGETTVVLIPEGVYARKIEHVCTTQITIGREETCDICIRDDAAVSGVHCIIFYNRRGELCVRDNRSSNGTYLNNEQLQDVHLLETGDVLEIGRIRYNVQIKKQKKH